MPDFPTHPAAMRVHPPHPALARHVACYWVSHAAGASSHRVLPDGCVDVVCAWAGTRTHVRAHGTTTRPRELAVASHGDYLGVRFRPGQSRHFLAVPAAALVDTDAEADCAVPWVDGLRSLDVRDAALVAALDRLLLRRLARYPVRMDPVDALLARMPAAADTPGRSGAAIDELCRLAGVGPRQAERLWHAAVGLPMAAFLGIRRARQAARRLAGSPDPIADVAALAGYADQSHLTRAMRRYLHTTPRALRRAGHVGIVQDAGGQACEDIDSNL